MFSRFLHRLRAVGVVLLLCAAHWHTAVAAAAGHITVCSFNIQFLGQSTSREDAALADVVKDYDIVVVQELVAPPYAMEFPSGEPVNPDPQAAAFFDAMKDRGFEYVLSPEDTGTGDEIHRNTSATEWFVAFYKPGTVSTANDLPRGYLEEDRSNHVCYERVPFAFPFRSTDNSVDFVLISVHLKPNPGPKDRARRKHELAAIAEWVEKGNESEKDFIILGDMNIYNAEELEAATPSGFLSLNDECRKTNTASSAKPYDHVMYRPSDTREVDTDFDLQVVDLVEAVRSSWDAENGVFPGDPYNHDEFRKRYSDHNPVVFRILLGEHDDD